MASAWRVNCLLRNCSILSNLTRLTARKLTNNKGSTLKTLSAARTVCCLKDCPVIYTASQRFQYTYTPPRRSRTRLTDPRKSREFIATLRRIEREMLLAELQKYQTYIEEGASLTSKEEVPPSTTGTPTSQQLGLVAFSNALPFLGFGFFDNAIMIIAGDYIDINIGAALSISTMAAAGLGNMISDVAGIGLAGTVEAMVARVGIQIPELTPEQLDMTRTRWTAGISRAIGIAIGCFIGMFPLLFLDTKEDKEANEEESAS